MDAHMPTTNDLIIRINDDDGNSLEEHRFDARKFLTAEAINAEKVTGMSWAQIMINAQMGSVTALSAVLWLLRKRKDPKLRYADVVFNTGDIEIFDPDSDERYAEPEPEPDGESETVPADDSDDATEGKD